MHLAFAGRPLTWPALLLGFSLGGFFDGILLHQILQWHHLLSGLNAVRDMRVQLLADGLFHALMYLVAVIALIALWRRRAVCAAQGTGRLVGGCALMGFGLWHIVDAVASHWITGIHRVKLDAASPLLWDLIWFVAFGVVPAVLGWRMFRSGQRGGGPGRMAGATLAVAALLAGPLAALPGRASDQVLVLFAPGVGGGAAFNALARRDARILWVDGSGGLWAVSMKDPSQAWKLYADGALLVSSSLMAFGCFSWTQAVAGESVPPEAPVRAGAARRQPASATTSLQQRAVTPTALPL